MAETSYKYQRIASALRHRIRGGGLRPGDRLPGEQELATEFKVSHLTLRRALRELADEGLVEQRWRSGTFVGGGRQAVGVAGTGLVLYVGKIHDHGYHALYLALTREAQSAGRLLSAFEPGGEVDEQAARAKIRQFLDHRPTLICSAHCAAMVAELAGATELPIVVADLMGVEPAVAALGGRALGITVDWQAATKLATRYLIEKGHRRIAMLDTIDGEPKEVLVGRPAENRDSCRGYLQALADAGIAESYIFGHRWDCDTGMAPALDWLLAQHDAWPTAFVCEGDFRAGPIIRELALRGRRVPDDISVIGIGNTPWSEMVSPPLSTINLGEAEVARLALLLAESGSHGGTSSVLKVTPTVVERGSVRPVEEPAAVF